MAIALIFLLATTVFLLSLFFTDDDQWKTQKLLSSLLLFSSIGGIFSFLFLIEENLPSDFRYAEPRYHLGLKFDHPLDYFICGMYAFIAFAAFCNMAESYYIHRRRTA